MYNSEYSTTQPQNEVMHKSMNNNNIVIFPLYTATMHTILI